MQKLSSSVRANQRATDVIDNLLCRLMGLNRTDGRCMDLLDERGPMSAGELAAEERLTSGAITAVIDRLERAGYARRVPDPSDRRRVIVELTEAAHEQVEELMGAPMWEAAQRLQARFTDEQLELLLEWNRLGIEIQENHAEWLREKLRERQEAASEGATAL